MGLGLIAGVGGMVTDYPAGMVGREGLLVIGKPGLHARRREANVADLLRSQREGGMAGWTNQKHTNNVL